MNLDRYPLWVISLGVFLMVLAAMEGGYRLGGVERRRPEFEKEAPVSAISGSILGLLAFMLAFTFGIVASRFDDRKELVREEANTIRTVIARSEFLPEGDRGRAVGLLKTYLALRLEIVSKRNMITIERNLSECGDIQKDLWRMAVANARKDMNSDVAALYVEALNDMAAFHAKRVSLGLKTRVPAGIARVVRVDGHWDGDNRLSDCHRLIEAITRRGGAVHGVHPRDLADCRVGQSAQRSDPRAAATTERSAG